MDAPSLAPDAALRRLRERMPQGGRIYAPGCSGEALVFVEALRAAPALADGLTFHGVWIPGVNRTDYAALSPGARAESIFAAPDREASRLAGRMSLLPLSYTQAFRRLETIPLGAALVQTSPPGPDGRLTLGVSADFAPAILQRTDVFKIAHVNPLMPAPVDGVAVARETFDIVVETPHPPLAYEPPRPTPIVEAIAAEVARLVGDGATLQLGLGAAPYAVLRALRGRRRLSICSGMATDGVFAAIEAGAIDARPGAVAVGVALGSQDFYARAAADPRFRFAPVSFTHAFDRLARTPDFVAINSALEVDLFGQANAEFVDGKTASGAGGLVDFLRGAGASVGGKPVVALASTTRGGAVSRIVPRLAAPALSVARADMGFVVTEHGIADLRGLDVEARAAALIGVAHPDWRGRLRSAWSDMARTL